MSIEKINKYDRMRKSGFLLSKNKIFSILSLITWWKRMNGHRPPSIDVLTGEAIIYKEKNFGSYLRK